MDGIHVFTTPVEHPFWTRPAAELDASTLSREVHATRVRMDAATFALIRIRTRLERLDRLLSSVSDG